MSTCAESDVPNSIDFRMLQEKKHVFSCILKKRNQQQQQKKKYSFAAELQVVIKKKNRWIICIVLVKTSNTCDKHPNTTHTHTQTHIYLSSFFTSS